MWRKLKNYLFRLAQCWVVISPNLSPFPLFYIILDHLINWHSLPVLFSFINSQKRLFFFVDSGGWITATNFCLHMVTYENEVILRGQNISLECCQPLELLTHFRNGIRSLHIFYVGSLGQRAAKLLAVKVVGLKEKSAA